MNNIKIIKFQFIGTFVYYKNVDLDEMELTYFESVANRLQIPFTEALLDPFFYHKLRLEKYQSYNDLKGETYSGLDVNSFHQMELFVDGQKKEKFNYSDINPETILFPLYNSNKTIINLLPNKLLLSWKEKGVIIHKTAISKTPINSILSFKIIDCFGYKLISEIMENNVPLRVEKMDTIITL